MKCESRVIRLRTFEETQGRLRKVKQSDECCLAEIGPVTLLLPEEMGKMLRQFIGSKIDILRTDLDYRLRILELKKGKEDIESEEKASMEESRKPVVPIEVAIFQD